MWWESRGDTSAIWYDNWSNLDPNKYIFQMCKLVTMKDTVEFSKEEGCDYTKMRDFVLEYMVDHVQANLHPAYLSNKVDNAWRTEISNGKFTVKSVWGLLRIKKDKIKDMQRLWIKGIPFKI
ncbi:hypothetical protein KY289_005312 [Solanum tuberosum]|nr:hypothetical protein KY289_005312 [Solanum tuberosum]